MPLLFHMVLTSSEFNDSDFFVPTLGNHGRSDFAALDKRLADFYSVARLNHKHLVKLYAVAGAQLKFFDF